MKIIHRGKRVEFYSLENEWTDLAPSVKITIIIIWEVLSTCEVFLTEKNKRETVVGISLKSTRGNQLQDESSWPPINKFPLAKLMNLAGNEMEGPDSHTVVDQYIFEWMLLIKILKHIFQWMLSTSLPLFVSTSCLALLLVPCGGLSQTIDWRIMMRFYRKKKTIIVVDDFRRYQGNYSEKEHFLTCPTRRADFFFFYFFFSSCIYLS